MTSGKYKKTEEHKRKIAESKFDDKNPQWKGDNVSKTSSLHEWIQRRKPKSEFCENCNIKRPMDLANISNLYKRDINDFEWLCRGCHMEKDGRLKKLLSHVRRRPSKNGKFLCSKCKLYKTKKEFYKDNNRINKIQSNCISCEYPSSPKLKGINHVMPQMS